jgi:zinc D-Ala-D-Ala carboxypeptidase
MRGTATRHGRQRFPARPALIVGDNLRDWLRFVDGQGTLRWMAKRDGRETVQTSGQRTGLLPTRRLQALAPPRSSEPVARGACLALGIDWQTQLARGLRPVAEPAQLLSPGSDHHGRRLWLAPAACRAWLRLRAAAAADGVVLVPIRGFRAVAWQRRLLEQKLARGQSLTRILAVSAAPGYSEHHGGNALDLATPDDPALEERFERTAAFDWLTRRAPAFGFRMTLPRGNPFGYVYEPWHWCYGQTGPARRQEPR